MRATLRQESHGTDVGVLLRSLQEAILSRTTVQEGYAPSAQTGAWLLFDFNAVVAV
jgi:hypothetical protein